MLNISYYLIDSLSEQSDFQSMRSICLRMRVIDCKVNDFFETLTILGKDSGRHGQDLDPADLNFLVAV